MKTFIIVIIGCVISAMAGCGLLLDIQYRETLLHVGTVVSKNHESSGSGLSVVTGVPLGGGLFLGGTSDKRRITIEADGQRQTWNVSRDTYNRAVVGEQIDLSREANPFKP